MKILQSYPPNIDQIKEHFNPSPTAVFTYAPNIYSPSTIDLPIHLQVHEQMHLSQQGDNPQDWWDNYIKDPQFRLDQEVEAYRAQYKKLSNNMKNLTKLERELAFLIIDLSGPMYGYMVSLKEAKELITHV